MGINLTNFLSSKSKSKRMMEFQDLDHIDGVSISTVSANLYNNSRDDLVMFYFRDGANSASVYTQSKIISENIKWNLNQKAKKHKREKAKRVSCEEGMSYIDAVPSIAPSAIAVVRK